jgi:hypothetical protein
MTPAPIRSRKVRKVLALEARARRLLTRYERALDKAVRAKAEVHHLLDQAHGIEWSLTGSQLSELHRGRAERGARPTHPDAACGNPSSPTTPPQ